MIKFAKRVLTACAKTILAYDKLIKTGDNSKWRDYGSNCRICNAAGYWHTFDQHACKKCPLSYPHTDDPSPDDSVLCYCSDNDSYILMRNISGIEVIDKSDKQDIREAAKARRKWLVSQLNRISPEWKNIYACLKRKAT